MRLADLGAPNAELIGVSKWDQARRTYRCENRTLKVVNTSVEKTQANRNRTLASEGALLKDIGFLGFVPQNPVFEKRAELETLAYDYIPGKTLEKISFTGYSAVVVVCRIFLALWRLSWRGVVHGDLLPDNVIISSQNRVFLIDFDQSVQTSRRWAFLTNLFGKTSSGEQIWGSFMLLAKTSCRRWVNLAKAVRSLKNLIKVPSPKSASTEGERSRLPELGPNPSNGLRKLTRAWRIAQLSKASYPSRPTAYYELRYEGVTLPGERPWASRWRMLSRAIELRGNRVLELGCNMGLLATYACKYAGASASLGIDREPDIIRAAQLVAAAHETDVDFRAIDLDSTVRWESELFDWQPDVVFALNVFHWLENKERFASFLSRCPCLVYEGHRSQVQEIQFLKNLSFFSVEVVGYTERERAVIVARKL